MQQGDWVYYCNTSDKNYLYKMKTDGTGRTKLNSEHSASINVVDDWIYYSKVSSNSNAWSNYKIRTDGTEDQQVK
ncbi:putative cell-wall-anchored protein SasA (LPXTG motif) [Desulfosporosinus metallidurans]|uniref:Putative cell-wall-anchored protein SasA (LPXTG motif) n=1 Tax=Desulfosporosinus metallidurans TaxID=1888891 RepID=A0A1Q8QWT4_9FIRM|nr:putative cell-wall-anchored protein SasA (LPXTG motif) [Desulfosporosinus metallidurans]